MRRYITLTTPQMNEATSISFFQFGTVAAETGTFGQLVQSVAPGRESERIFFIDDDMKIGAGDCCRFNLILQANVHNAVFIQVRLQPSTEPDEVASVDWRWGAAIGSFGVWSADTQQAPWYDSGTDYCIRIDGREGDVDLTLSEHPGTKKTQCELIPPLPTTSGPERPELIVRDFASITSNTE